MNLADAMENSRDANAIAYSEDGRIHAEVRGVPHCLSKRKRKKRGKSVTVTIWTPPKPDTPLGYLARCRLQHHKLHEVSKKTRRWLDSLDWRPRKVRSVVDRLAALTRRM